MIPRPVPRIAPSPLLATTFAALGALAPVAVAAAQTTARAAPATAPAVAPATAIERVLRVSIGEDGTVASVVTLRGPGADEAVVLRRGDAATLVARTGTTVTVADGQRFVLRAIGRAWTAGGAMAYLGTTREGPPVLVLHGEAGDRLIAVGADPDGALVGGAPRPVVGAAGCAVELEVFDLLDAGAAPLADDGSVRFPAWLDGPCAGTRAEVRYRAGTWALESVSVAPAPVTATQAGVPRFDVLPAGIANGDGPGVEPIDPADGTDPDVPRP